MSTPLTLDPTRYQPGLDLLRFVAAVMVMLYHFMYTFFHVFHLGPSYTPLDSVARYGYLGVNIFFMLSGYLILQSARQKPLRQFVVARVARLYPTFWLSCLLTFVGLRWGGNAGFGPAPTIRNLLYNLTMVEEFFGCPPLNGAYWTLTLELVFYLLVALVVGARLWPYLLQLIVGWLFLTLLAGPEPGDGLFKYLLFPAYSPFFMLGMLLSMRVSGAAPPRLLDAVTLLAGLLALRSARAEIMRHNAFFHEQQPPQWLVVATVLVGAFVLIALISRQQLPLPATPLWRFLGQLTYPLYLLHGLGMGLILVAGGLPPYVLLALMVLVVGLLSWATYRWVEVPVGRWLRRSLLADVPFSRLRPREQPPITSSK